MMNEYFEQYDTISGEKLNDERYVEIWFECMNSNECYEHETINNFATALGVLSQFNKNLLEYRKNNPLQDENGNDLHIYIEFYDKKTDTNIDFVIADKQSLLKFYTDIIDDVYKMMTLQEMFEVYYYDESAYPNIMEHQIKGKPYYLYIEVLNECGESTYTPIDYNTMENFCIELHDKGDTDYYITIDTCNVTKDTTMQELIDIALKQKEEFDEQDHEW